MKAKAAREKTPGWRQRAPLKTRPEPAWPAIVFIGSCFLAFILAKFSESYSVVRSGAVLNTPNGFLWMPLPVVAGAMLPLWPRLRDYIEHYDTNSLMPRGYIAITAISIFPCFLVAWGVLVTLLLIVNGALDHGKPGTHTTILTGKYVTTGSKSGTHYFFNFTDWRDGHSEYRADVPPWLYGKKQPGAPLVFTTKPGALGYEWIVNIE